jgi:hypothetical protein
MSAARRSRAPYTRQVFLNCPYDDEYRPLLKAIVFAVHACEFTARLALEEPGSERLRLERLVSLIAECRLGIHDLSRVRSSDQEALPRFNMPFECGVFYGALQFGTKRQAQKRFLLLDSVPYRPQRTMSDAAGLDPRSHHDNPAIAVACVRDFLAMDRNPRPMGATKINALYEEFQTDLPQLAREADLEATELEPLTAFNDWHFFAGQWLAERARQAR